MTLFTLSALALQQHAPRILKVRSLRFNLLQSSRYSDVFMWLNFKTLMFFADYMVEKLGIDRRKISELGNLLYRNYGTTMSGLRVWLSFQTAFCFSVFLGLLSSNKLEH